MVGIGPADLGVPALTPEIIKFSPEDDQVLPLPFPLVITYHEDVQAGSGNITIRNVTDTVDTVIPIGDAQVSISGAVVTITPSVALLSAKNYAVLIDNGAVEDLDGNAHPGIADETTWNFTTL